METLKFLKTVLIFLGIVEPANEVHPLKRSIYQLIGLVFFSLDFVSLVLSAIYGILYVKIHLFGTLFTIFHSYARLSGIVSTFTFLLRKQRLKEIFHDIQNIVDESVYFKN